jgi:hypothetical protein
VETHNGDRTITATSVDLSAPDKNMLVKPKQGKKVTPEEYRKIIDEKMKEMGGEGGSGQQVIIRIQQ